MDPRLKVGLVVGTLFALLAAPLVYTALGAGGTEGFEKILASAEREGRAYGAGVTDEACMKAALGRLADCDSGGCTAARTRYLQGCFATASHAPAFCDGVPHPGEDANGNAWLDSHCLGLPKEAHDACVQPYQVKYLHCREPEIDEMLRKRLPEDKRDLWNPSLSPGVVSSAKAADAG